MLTEIEKLDALGRECGLVIYSVHQCRAGWGVQWYENGDDAGEQWRERLAVYDYYSTITEMVEGEKKRLANYSAGLLKK